MPHPSRTVAEIVADFLVARGVDRIFGLQGGHIQPIWDELAQRGVRIVDVRDEGAAVHMAHAHAALGGGQARVGVAMATTGPGVTNCFTAITNAHLDRVPVLLIGGCPPRPQDDLRPLQGIDHVARLAPVTRQARTLRVAEQIARNLDKAWAMAVGDGNSPGPVYIEIPTHVLRARVPPAFVLAEHLRAKPRRGALPDAAEVARAAEALRRARRPLVITGRGAGGCTAELTALLDASGAVYLDTQESRGLVDPTHAAVVGAVRAKAMQEADLVLVVGRKLDYQLAHGSPAVFKAATFLRMADHADELRDNRRGEVEILADTNLALRAVAQALQGPSPALDSAWTTTLRAEHVNRATQYADSLGRAEPGRDGHMHPNRIFAALRQVLRPDARRLAQALLATGPGQGRSRRAAGLQRDQVARNLCRTGARRAGGGADQLPPARTGDRLHRPAQRCTRAQPTSSTATGRTRNRRPRPFVAPGAAWATWPTAMPRVTSTWSTARAT